MALLLAWVPVLLICALVRPSGRPRMGTLALIAVLALIVNMFFCLLFSPYRGIGWMGADPEAVECREQPLGRGWVRYLCTPPYDSDGVVHVLYG